MNVILDECLPRRLNQQLTDHEVTTVPAIGLSGVTNGKLLEAIQDRLDAFQLESHLAYHHFCTT
jgi:hypothetical protein